NPAAALTQGGPGVRPCLAASLRGARTFALLGGSRLNEKAFVLPKFIWGRSGAGYTNPILPHSWRNPTMFALRYLALPVSLSLGLLLASSGRADENLAEKKVELKNGDRIIFFGDSLTALAGKEEPKTHVTKGYVRIVKETLKATHKDKDIEVDWIATG